MACERVLELVPTFVDGEASESLASAVRKHLIDCGDCRVVVQEEKSLRQWFEPIAGEAGRTDIIVPQGFAARVTAMAFDRAGSSGQGAFDPSTANVTLTQHLAGSRSESQERRGPRLLRPLEGSRSAGPERNSLGFLIGLTSVAAALMVTFTLMLAQDKRLDVGDAPLSADAPLDETLRELEALNEAEMQTLENAAARTENPDGAAPVNDSRADTRRVDPDSTDAPGGDAEDERR